MSKLVGLIRTCAGIGFRAVLLFVFCTGCPIGRAHAQTAAARSVHAGLELDVLPYATGGYFAAVCVGRDRWRLRGLTADVNKPDWSIASGFTHHHITAYALVLDLFLKPGRRGWWIGGGPVYWKSRIQTDARLQTAHFENYLLNGSLGYNIKIGRHFYVSPWAGLSLRLNGKDGVAVDQKKFTLPLLNPEASVKAGVWF